MINQTQTRKRPPTCAVLKRKTETTKQLISKAQQQELRERLKMVYWKSIPLQLDRLFKANTGPVIKQNYFDLSKLQGTQKRAAILMLIDKLNFARGGYQNNIRKQLDNACGVVYRKSTPKPFKFSQMEPGPDYYCPCDDLLKRNTPAFTFAKEGMKPLKPIVDSRDYLINEDFLKKGGNIIINPVHSQHRLSEQQIKRLERGPGFYDCLFGQVQRRQDKGNVKYQQITEKNDRQNNCIEIKQVNDAFYFPSYDVIDKNVPAPLYKQSAKIFPQHIPDKQLFPQHWLFYDGDLNKVRAQIAKNVLLAKGMSYKQYKQYKEKFDHLKKYIQMQKQQPEIGQYKVQFTALDKHVPGFQLSKMQDKTLLQPITKPEFDAHGDNLILNPKDLQPHLPNIDFKKMNGRPNHDFNEFDAPSDGQVLVLDPKKPEKHIPNIYIDKYQKRDNNVEDDRNEPRQGDVLVLNPKQVQRHIANIDIKRQAQREIAKINYQQKEQYIEVKQSPVKRQQKSKNKRKVKQSSISRKSSVRLVPELRKKKKQSEQQQDDQE